AQNFEKQQQQGQGQGQDQKKQQDQKKEQDQANSQPKPQQQPQDEGRRRQYKGSSVSKDVAESLMNDLSDREKQLHQKRFSERKSKEAPNDKDW
ncbi:MAG: hypothetical protein EBX52_12900, partial [Proteobacteria bacterium]|nr:hypothetical protein [Pseudomonadota bacterium]